MNISLSSCPSPQKTYAVSFPRLTGGLNLWELDYRMGADQSPNMKNLWWQDGVLQCRDGQRYVWEDTALGAGFTCYQSTFWGYAFFHMGDGLYCAKPGTSRITLTKLRGGVPENRGTFFRYLDWLFYKNRGGFFRITYNGEEGSFTAEDMAALAYTPVITLNAHPAYGSGDPYQPENRLSPRKTVRYNPEKDVKEYHLPETGVDSVEQVIVDGVTLVEGTGYTVDKGKGTVTFAAAPPVTDPPTNNTVEITYAKANPDAYRSVMDCTHALVAGGDRSLCILLGGCEGQPNGVFWNDRDSLSMNPGYFPMTYYNLVGDTEDPVTGFGRQYGDTIVFKQRSVGKLAFSVEELDGRQSISFSYTGINSRVGCDLPWSIQLIENNLVFCNTSQGVHIIRSSSAAYENNVECISRNVNGSRDRGLLRDVRAEGVVVGFDDDNRYWLCANGNVYLWDYVLSAAANPSWFFFTSVPAAAWFRDGENNQFHLDKQGRVTLMARIFSDYDGPIEKLYQFPTQHFGRYDRLKDVTDILISVRSDTDTDISIRYDTDYGTRSDSAPILSRTWRLFPRDLAQRSLSVARYAHVVRRRPGCRHVRHFAMTFSNSAVGCDLAVVSAQILYKFQGKER